jgi:hypothetical protein
MGEFLVILSKSHEDKKIKTSGVNVTEYESTVVFYMPEPGIVRVYAEYHDNPQIEQSKSTIEKTANNFIRSFLAALSIDPNDSGGDNTPGAKEIRKVLDDSMTSAFAI